MLKRFIVPALVTAVAFFVSPGNSQVQSTGDPAQDQMIQDMRDAAAQAQQNMQQQGIDPQQFGQQLMQQMQNGTLDPEKLQQQLIDSGIISQETMTRMQSSAQQLAMSYIRRQLASTDEEWAVLEVKMRRVVDALSDVGQPGPASASSSMGLRIIAGGKNTATPVTVSMKELQALLEDPNATTDQLTRKVAAWRTAHEAAKVELVNAREDLRMLLTLRQEGILLGLGVLD